ncbi:MAG TPA: phage baseplate assembly protein V [Terriglobia bacterium]|nr:phage baseplate assembly protein V [Terriglobia bacterium]
MAFYGVYKGVVTDSNDPSGLGRVKVRMEVSSADMWALVVQPVVASAPVKIPAGSNVIVGFERGDPSHPVVLGRIAGH